MRATLVALYCAALAPPMLAPVPSSAQTARPAALDPMQRSQVIGNIAAAAEARYVDPAAGRRIAAHLRQRLAVGAYDGMADPIAFAAAITADVQSVMPDVHLRAVYEPNRSAQTVRVVAPAGQPAPAGSVAGPRNFGRIDPRSEAQIARSNFGFDAVQRLGGNVGYLRMSRFVPLAMSEPTAGAAMAFLANSDAVIVDLRGNIGGAPDLVQRLISYFTGPEPVQLMESYFREGDRTEKLMSLAEVPGQRLTGKPLYVLIDARTASAAEMFAYFAQHRKLGTVVGMVSAGAGNGGAMFPAGSDISFFLTSIKLIDGPGWERTGVTPDIAAAPENALDTAHRGALADLVARATEPAVKREREWALELLTQAAAPAGALDAYAGSFGTRSFKVEQGRLVAIPAGSGPQPLQRVAPDIFRTETSRYSFERNAAGAVTAVRVETLSGTDMRAARDAG
ncbi:S41 family peptidase [Sphingomonas sp. HITSZ_GF]|uniref:S41 family peptidase n=1 Tax=Sphingomonas sp. HITSZ_GF TaxID=3037247 RepID=UPI00240E99E5|nr:S41 family peptidase [Sphingomonas sp. HITSZ_GF]MDG2534677.1 S41 family peptidase [Sphingomonas sp. HITSZ_GF]